MNPFISIVTRACRRPRLLTNCIESVLRQTLVDIEQVFLVDQSGKHDEGNVTWANEQFWKHKDLVRGQYVFMLDDDGVMVDQEFVKNAKRLVKDYNPDVILVHSMTLGNNGMTILPPVDIWNIDWENGQRAEYWAGHGYNTVAKRECWERAIRGYIGQERGGDWHYHTALLGKDVSVRRLWGTISARSTQRGKGELFEVNQGVDWFNPIARKYGLEQIGSSEWRLVLCQ